MDIIESIKELVGAFSELLTAAGLIMAIVVKNYIGTKREIKKVVESDNVQEALKDVRLTRAQWEKLKAKGKTMGR